MNETELQALLRKNPDLNVVQGYGGRVTESPLPAPPPKHKYHAEAVEIEGVRFDSKKEARRYVTLRNLERAGQISDLALQPRFLLQEGFTDSAGKKQRPIHYVGDFQYVEDGRVVVEDTKGMETAVFKLKRKLLLFRYRDIVFRQT